MHPPEERAPTRFEIASLQTKIVLLRLRRGFQNIAQPVPKLAREPFRETFKPIAAQSTNLIGTTDAGEIPMEIGKVQNLRLVARELDGLFIPAGQTFSFWRHVGRCTARKGYVPGRQITAGCIVPTVGGGICQLTNALYDLALKSGCEIVERHPHTRRLSSHNGEADATVAWNHIDLRWRSDRDMQLKVALTSDRLLVEFWAEAASVAPLRKPRESLAPLIQTKAHTCGTCDQVDCHLFSRGVGLGEPRTSFLVDEYWPEFDEYIAATKREGVAIHLPLDGSRRNKANYCWSTDALTVREELATTLIRSYRLRQVKGQGAERQRVRLEALERLSAAYSKRINYMSTHLVISLDLLPYLWKAGVLSGRTFDVLMTRFPLGEVHRRLDEALAHNPDKPLLGDFRASADLIRLEQEALREARHLITPHRASAAEDPRRKLLDWSLPEPTHYAPGKVLVYPGPSTARKGSHLIRNAALELGLPVMILGSNLDGPEFWRGVELVSKQPNFLDGALAVVQPAVLEDKPRILLKALASGCPVIATDACGLSGMAGVTDITDDGLIQALNSIRKERQELAAR